MVELRPYQSETIRRLRSSVASGAKAPCLQVPTGGGKTIIAGGVISSALDRGRRVLFLVHRRELAHQTSEKLDDLGVPHGILMSGHETRLHEPVQIASIQTLASRLKRESFRAPKADLVIVDEAHRSASPQYRKILENHYTDAVVMGLTATPCRSDGTGLGVVFDDLVQGPTVSELTDMGYLVPVRYFAPEQPALDDVEVRGGDYVETQLAAAMDKADLTGDIVSNWHRLAGDRQTVVFASSVAHSRHLAERFRETGVRAEHIDGETFREERDDIIRRVKRGDVQVLCNCLVTTEGWDAPEVSCAVLARPTKSLGLYLQMAGRVLRPASGKDDALIIDHSGAVYEHGFVDDPQDWTLSSKERVQDRKKEREKKEPARVTCDSCGYVYQKKPACPNCGFVPPKKTEPPEVEDGDLVEVNGKKTARKWTKPEKQRWYSMLLGYAQNKGYKDGWAAHKYREKVGVWPQGLDRSPVQPDGEVMGWIKHIQIRDAKRREKAA